MSAAAIELSREIPGVGTLSFRETEKRRDYWLLAEGAQRRVRLPSVTSVLRETWAKPHLLHWYAEHGRQAPVLLEQASARGKDVHRFVETFMSTGEILPFESFPAQHRGYLQGIARFLWERDPKPIETELLVCHPELNYAGRLDLIAAVDDVVTLLDFKSNPSGRVYHEAHVQCIGYTIANDRCTGPAVERTMIVGISETGGCFPVAGEMDVTRKVWASALDYYRTLKRLERALNGAG